MDVHPEDARDQRHGEQDHADDGEHAQDVVLAVVDRGLVRVLERLDDLLVVVEQIPDSLRGVDQVVVVGLQLLGQESLDVALEQPQRRTLRLDDLAIGDDLLLRLRDVADHLVETLVVDVVLDRVELVRDLVEDREAVVEEVVQDLVQQSPGAASEQLASQLLVLLAPREETGDWVQLAVRDRDDVVVPDEDVELGGVQPLDGLVVDGEVEDREEVTLVLVVVDLRALTLRDDVLHVQWMPAEALGELLGGRDVGRDDMSPGQSVGRELGDAGFRACEDFPVARAGPRSLDPRQAWHRY